VLLVTKNIHNYLKGDKEEKIKKIASGN